MPSYTFILLLSCNIESHSFSVFITISDWYSVSTFGAVLDMVTDRPGLVFVSLPVLDIGSQWLQMYRKVLLSLGKMPTTLYLCCSTFLTGKTRHKDAKDSTNWLFKAYYGNRMFMGYCCVACEVVATAVQQGSPLSFLVALSLFAWAQSSKRLMSYRRQPRQQICVCHMTSRKSKSLKEFINIFHSEESVLWFSCSSAYFSLSLERFSQTAQTVSTEVQREPLSATPTASFHAHLPSYSPAACRHSVFVVAPVKVLGSSYSSMYPDRGMGGSSYMGSGGSGSY
ncbi:hypothetical protein CUMW_151130 [Citrus unshiu]|uniref:Uncharacterized protein n=1 Tax=Citrus unshiu TaxID=55188 RepID=A0A2H5PMW6_CITUN|nr:hypothetical protein CUMW_151130 [Citrus unshiu]